MPRMGLFFCITSKKTIYKFSNVLLACLLNVGSLSDLLSIVSAILLKFTIGAISCISLHLFYSNYNFKQYKATSILLKRLL